MEKLGILGGMGPESTLDYYKKIVYQYEEQMHTKVFPNINIESIDIFSMLALCQQKQYEALADMLVNGIDKIYRAGATVGLIAANTPHIVFDEVQRRSPIPLISIITATLDKVKQNKQRTVGLLGTQFTMTQGFFEHPFLVNHIKVVLPKESDIVKVNHYIVNELEQGVIKATTKQYLIRIVNDMIASSHIEGLILGCTEIPLILNQADFEIPVYDTTQIHVNRAVDYLLNHQ